MRAWCTPKMPAVPCASVSGAAVIKIWRCTDAAVQLAHDAQRSRLSDESHTPIPLQVLGAGKTDGAMDAANLLKPMLARGELRCIGATTLAEYRQHMEKDAAFERRFQQVREKATLLPAYGPLQWEAMLCRWLVCLRHIKLLTLDWKVQPALLLANLLASAGLCVERMHGRAR